MALAEKSTVKTVTFIAGEDLSDRSKLYVPLKRGTGENEVVQATAPTDNIIGFLYSLGKKGTPINVTRDNNYIKVIAHDTSITAKGDKVMLCPAVSSLCRGVVKLSGSTQDCLGEAEEVPTVAGNFILIHFRKTPRI